MTIVEIVLLTVTLLVPTLTMFYNNDDEYNTLSMDEKWHEIFSDDT